MINSAVRKNSGNPGSVVAQGPIFPGREGVVFNCYPWEERVDFYWNSPNRFYIPQCGRVTHTARRMGVTTYIYI